jgi:hypothetical protein
VDRGFDLAEQTLTAYRHFTLSLVGVADRQVDTALETAESSTSESLRGVEALLREAGDDRPQPGSERSEQPPARRPKAQKPRPASRTASRAPSRIGAASRPQRRRAARPARELDIEGRASMSKDELIAALREHAK